METLGFKRQLQHPDLVKGYGSGRPKTFHFYQNSEKKQTLYPPLLFISLDRAPELSASGQQDKAFECSGPVFGG